MIPTTIFHFSQLCSETKKLYTEAGCCPSSSRESWTENIVRPRSGFYDGYLCKDEANKPIFDKNSVDGADNINFWANENSGANHDVTAAQLRALHESKYNMKTSNCPAHVMAYGWLTGQFLINSDDATMTGVNIKDSSPEICDPNLMRFSNKIDRSYEMEYAVNVRSSLKDMYATVRGSQSDYQTQVNVGPSRLPCYMWQGPGNNASAREFKDLNDRLKCDQWPPNSLSSMESLLIEPPDIISNQSFIDQMHTIVNGPDSEPYSTKNRFVVQLLQGLGWQHLSFAFREAYWNFPSLNLPEEMCVTYPGPGIPYVKNMSPNPPAYYPPLPEGGQVCIAVDKTKDYAYLTDIEANRTVTKIYNNNFFMTSYISQHFLAFTLATQRIGGSGVGMRHITVEDCEGGVPDPVGSYGCPTFLPPVSPPV